MLFNFDAFPIHFPSPTVVNTNLGSVGFSVTAEGTMSGLEWLGPIARPNMLGKARTNLNPL